MSSSINRESDSPVNDDNTTTTTYKDKLDEIATRMKHPHKAESTEPTTIEKVTETVSHYLPAVGKMLGRQDAAGSGPLSAETTATAVGGPPDRPKHDPQIEEFIRDTHKSMPVTGTEE